MTMKHQTHRNLGDILAEHLEQDIPDDINVWPGVLSRVRTVTPVQGAATAAPQHHARRLRPAFEVIAGVTAIVVVSVMLVAVFRPSPSQEQSQGALVEPVVPAQLIMQDSMDSTRPWAGTLARPVDPDTLVDLPGIEPVDLSQFGAHALSPDGTRLIGVVSAGDARGTPCNDGAPSGRSDLRIFNLETWQWEHCLGFPSFSASLSLSFSWLLWSSDGTLIYALTTDDSRSAEGGKADGTEIHRLWIIDPSGAAEPQSVPISFAVGGMFTAPDGEDLYLFGYPLDENERAWMLGGPARLVALDAHTGQERARIELPDVTIGQTREIDTAGQSVYQHYRPGFAMAPGGDRFYIAHADQPRVDVIDLASMRIERSVSLEEPASVVDSLLGIIVQPAAAKGSSDGERSIVVSPDGSTIYVTGVTGDETEWSPVGVIAVDISTWTFRRIDSTATQIQISPDGRWLYAVDRMHLQYAAPVDGRLRVLDADSGEEVKRLVDGAYVMQVAMYGIDHLYVTTPTELYHTTAPYPEGEQLVRVTAYAVGTWTELAQITGHLNLRIAFPSQ